MTSPIRYKKCKGCEKRVVGCHATCKDYLDFQAENEKILQEREKARLEYNDIRAVRTRHRKRKMPRK